MPIREVSKELFGAVLGQIMFGIFTLLSHIATRLDSASQTGALIVFSLILGAAHSCRDGDNLHGVGILHILRPAQPSSIGEILGRTDPGHTAMAILGIRIRVSVMNESSR